MTTDTVTPTGHGQISDTPAVSPQRPRLLDQVRDRIRVKHYSLRTEQAYVHWAKRFILHHGKRHPRDMGAAEESSVWSLEYRKWVKIKSTGF